MFTEGFVGTIGVVYVPNYAIYYSCRNCSDCMAKQLSVSFFSFHRKTVSFDVWIQSRSAMNLPLEMHSTLKIRRVTVIL